MTELVLSSEKLPLAEMQRRHNLCRTLCQQLSPQAGGIVVFSRLSIYYLTGTYADGVFWLPLQGTPLLFVRRAVERARAESPLAHIHLLTSSPHEKSNFGAQIRALCQDFSSPLSTHVAVEMEALPWNMAREWQQGLTKHSFTAADPILLRARSQKSSWELNKMRLAGARHHEGVYKQLPTRLRAGMSEREISHISWDVFFGLGHSGMNRMGHFGEECFLGHIAVGDNGNYPSHFNGPLGLKGQHPAIPYMGNSQSIWEKNQILALDIGYVLEGYHTDKTQVYFSGKLQQLPDVARKAHDACIEIQQRAAEALRPGAIPSEIWNETLTHAKRLGIEEGFMGIGGNKVPFLGHGIGLVIDEFPVIAARFDEPLMEGMTLAIEPKVGIAGLGMVGVENTFEVTPSGGISLTGNDFNIIEVEHV